MKTLRLFGIAALALMVMTACSKEADQPQQEQPEQKEQTELQKIHFIATVGNPDTRTVYTEDAVDNKIHVAWKVGDEIALVHNGVKDVATVTSVDGNGDATIEGDITQGYFPLQDNDPIKLVYPADLVYMPNGNGTDYYRNEEVHNKVFSQDGTLDYIQNNLDFREGSGNLSIAGSTASLKTSVKLVSKIAIWKLILRDNNGLELNATNLKVSVGSTRVAQAANTPRNGYYIALTPSTMGTGSFSMLAVSNAGNFTYTKEAGVTLTAGKFYHSNVQFNRANVINLADIHNHYTAQDGETLTGTLNVGSYPVKISIANNAVVTLDGITIEGIHGSTEFDTHNYPWAGLTCLGNATIVLKDGTTNRLRGFDNWYPGLYVPSGSTLTIQGTGTLYASSNEYGAGIGAASEINYDYSAGNIVIRGGTIIATGGYAAAGIGTAGHCSCGTVTIEKTVTSVIATRGDGATYSIGPDSIDDYSYCSGVYFGDHRAFNFNSWDPNPLVSGNYGGLNLVISTTTRTDDTWTLTPAPVEGKFTVNANGDQVVFSQGNLQYQATSNTWRFADNQWDYMGTGNDSRGSTYAGWIDMYCWGCNGINTGGSFYQPYIYGGSDGCYNPYNSDTANLYDSTGQADWGANTISNGGTYTWRTLKDWNYILNSRATGHNINSMPNARYTMATINKTTLNDASGVNGIILFPDNYTGPTANLIDNLTWGTINGASNYGTVCTAAGWLKLQNAGCVFLPAGGKGESLSSNISDAGTEGRYWSSSSGVTYKAYSLSFESSVVNPQDCVERYYSCSVRLVRDIKPNH